MIGVALKGLLGRKLRAILTAFAIVLGVAMISGAFILTDTLGKSFDQHLHRLVQGHRRRHQLEGRDQDGRRRPRRRPSRPPCSARSRASPASTSRRARSRTKSGSSTSRARPIGKPGNGTAIGVDAAADQSLNPLQLVAGAVAPAATGRSRSTWRPPRSSSFEVGQTVGAFGDGPLEQYRISGIVRFGSEGSLGGATISVFDLATAQRLFDKRGEFDLIRVGADDGVSEAELITQITRSSRRRRR